VKSFFSQKTDTARKHQESIFVGTQRVHVSISSSYTLNFDDKELTGKTGEKIPGILEIPGIWIRTSKLTDLQPDG